MSETLAEPVQGEVTPDEFHWWREAVANRRGVETERGNPRSGYYRVKNEAIAFWREDGELCVWRSGDFPAPRKPDAQDELFGWCAPHPVDYGAFAEFQSTGRWPEQLEPVAIDPSLPAETQTDAALTQQREAMAAWIKEIGKVETQEQADKAGSFADEFQKLESKATADHKTAKEPFLKGGREVDALWKPIIARAEELKKYAKKLPEAFLIAEKARIKAEDDARREAASKAAREAEEARRRAEATGAPPPAAEPVPLPPQAPPKAKAGKVHLRTVTKHEIVSMRDVLTFLANMNTHSGDLTAAIQISVNRLRTAGVEVPGVETKNVEVAA